MTCILRVFLAEKSHLTPHRPPEHRVAVLPRSTETTRNLVNHMKIPSSEANPEIGTVGATKMAD